MGRRSCIGVFLALSLLANVFCLPAVGLNRPRRQSSHTNESPTSPSGSSNKDINELPPVPFNDDDDDDDFNTPASDSSSSGGGSNISSLFNLLGAFLPGSSSSSSSTILQKLIKEFVKRNRPKIIIRRQDVGDNEIDIDYIADFKPPPFQRQEDNGNENSESENSESGSDEANDDTAAEESMEENSERNKSNQDSDSNIVSDIEEDDYDEPPEGDGQGGGLLGLLAGLSGGEDGQSDLGSLLATVSGIIANLSGDGIDLNALIASGIGLFVGLLSEGEENPGAVIASYLLTSLDTITGGGAKNNGAFFGTFLSKLVKGTSAAEDPDADSEEDDDTRPKMSDSAGFFASLLMSLLGNMSKTSSSSKPWRRSTQFEDSSKMLLHRFK